MALLTALAVAGAAVRVASGAKVGLRDRTTTGRAITAPMGLFITTLVRNVLAVQRRLTHLAYGRGSGERGYHQRWGPDAPWLEAQLQAPEQAQRPGTSWLPGGRPDRREESRHA